MSAELGSLSTTIQTIWELRFARKIRETEVHLEQLKNISKSVSFPPEIKWQIQLLDASLYRAQGNIAKSRQCIDLLSDDLKDVSQVPFQYYLQKGLNFFALDQFASALELFFQASRYAASDAEAFYAKMNALIALDNLHLPLGDIIAQLTDLTGRLDSHAKQVLRAPLRQLTAFQLRQRFRDGDFSNILAQAKCESEELDQAEYVKLWINELPYIAHNQTFREQGLTQLAQARELYCQSYRLETLTGDPRFHSEQDRDYAIETASQVDRIYLWTWKWLTNPRDSTRHQLRHVLRSFDFSGAIKKMTFEDYQMLSNALSWIALFQPLMATPISEYLKRFFVNSCEFFPVLKFERLCLDWLKQGDTSALDAVRSHPLSANPDLKIFALAEVWKQQLESGNVGDFPPEQLVFNPNTHQIWFAGQQLVSPPLVRVMSYLFKNKVMHFSEALSLGFHIGKYEEDVHVAKIHNLLNRLKKVLPVGSKVFARESIIYWEGPLEKIRELSPLPLQSLLFDNAFELCKREPAKREFAPSMHPRAVLLKAKGVDTFTRPELQSLLQMSKSSTIRWIEKWHDLGLVHPSGKGRAIRYQIRFSDDSEGQA
jgi:hypothetical protein